MASHALVCAHDNIFNASILGDDAYYFKNSDEVAQILKNQNKTDDLNREKISNNINKIKSTYSWPQIVQQYIDHFNAITANKTIRVQPHLNFIEKQS